MKFSNLIVLLLLVSSCSSYKYNSSYEDKKVIIKSENLNQYDVVDAATGSKIIRASSQESNVVIPDLRKKTVKLQLVHENYDMIELMIYRSPRGKALVKDLSLGLFTFGLPLWIDFFRSDFYKVSEKTKEFNVHFDYKQSFMKSELEKISKSKRPSDFQDWINKYPKSDQMIRAVDKRDSLEFQIALGMESEIAIDDFIRGHSVSSYLDDATAVKNEMVEARELFDDAKNKNNVIAYEKFLEKFPRSLHNKDAHRRLVDAAEKEALSSDNSGRMEAYIESYLIPNTSYLSKPELDIKKSNISNALDAQIIKENVFKDNKKTYEYYSNLWKSYVRIKSEISPDYLNSLDKTRAYQSKICDLLFDKLKEADSEVKQKELITKINADFPGLNEVEPTLNPILTVITNTKNGTGVLKLFNVGYLPYYFNNMSEYNALIGRSNYDYRGSEYQSLRGITNEELTFSNGQLNGMSKTYIGSQVDFTMNIGSSGPKEISYYQSGKLVKTTTFLQDKSEYSFEFENGVNLSLQELDLKLTEGDRYLKAGQFDLAINIIQSGLNYNYPSTLPQVKSLQKSLADAKSQKSSYERKQEELRLAAERERRIQEEKEMQRERGRAKESVLRNC